MSTQHQQIAVNHQPRANPLSAASDCDLLEAWRRDGCREALSTIIERYSVLVLSVCRRSCRSVADADDAYQSTFHFLVRSANQIRHPEQLPGWLHRVAQRAAIATLNRGAARSQPLIDVPSDPCDPLDRLTQRHAAIVLDEELARLPEHYRAAILLHIVQGESFLRLAEKWGTSVGTVRGRVQRGKQLLARRLRRRGIVPIVAFFAASHWTVSQATGGEAAACLVSDTAFPYDSVSPIEPTFLQQLLTQGSSTMTKSAVASAGLLGFALLAFFLHHLSLSGTSQNSRAETMLFAQIGSPAETGAKASFGSPTGEDATDSQPGSATAPQLGDRSPMKTEADARRSLTTGPTSRVAAAALQALDQEVQMPSSVSLDALPTLIQQSVSVPVMIDPRALEFVEASPDASIDFTQGQWPLRSALRGALRPLGLRAIVDDEGIVITADPAVLVHRGIGVSRWINVDEEAERVIASKLASRVSYSFVEETLENALRIIAEDQDLPLRLDRKALDDTPYTPDTAVNLTLSDVTLRTFLDLMLRDLELTGTIQGEVLVVTTPEQAELFPLTRIYWLEGTGLTGGSGAQLMDAIESIEPDAWVVNGGTASVHFISRGHDNRPAIIVSASYSIHHQLENLLAATRESHFGPDPEFVPADELPAATPMGSKGGGGFM